MNANELQTFVNNLCADDLSKLFQIIDTNKDAIISSKVSNHQIIKRERSKNNKQSCPLCKSISIVMNGRTKTNRQKYYCKNCHKNFSDTTNTIAYRSKMPYKVWNQVISDTLERKPLRQTAQMAGVSTTTAFAWRHKIMATLSTYKKDDSNNLSSIIEADSFYFPINLKGTKSHKMPRFSKKRTNSAKRGTSNHKVCVFTAVDDLDHTLIEIAGIGPESIDKLMPFKTRFNEESLLITDSKAAYIEFAKSNNMTLDQIPSGFKVSNEGNNISTVNGMHSQIRTFLSPFRGVSIKHLQGYLNLFRFYKDLRYTTEYTDMNDTTYCHAMPHYSSVFINDIYNKVIPIDLFKAYGDYNYGIYAESA